MTGPCAICDAPAEPVAELEPGVPLFVCERCLNEWAAEASARELRRRGTDRALVDAFLRRIRESDEPL